MTSYAFVTDAHYLLRVIEALYSAIYNRRVIISIITVLDFGRNFETFWGMPPKGSKGKKEKGKALPRPVLDPVQLEPAKEEVDRTTNVKAKKKKVATTFNEQQKEEITEFLMQNILNSKRLAGFKDVNKKEDLWPA